MAQGTIVSNRFTKSKKVFHPKVCKSKPTKVVGRQYLFIIGAAVFHAFCQNAQYDTFGEGGVFRRIAINFYAFDGPDIFGFIHHARVTTTGWNGTLVLTDRWRDTLNCVHTMTGTHDYDCRFFDDSIDMDMFSTNPNDLTFGTANLKIHAK